MTLEDNVTSDNDLVGSLCIHPNFVASIDGGDEYRANIRIVVCMSQ